MRQSRTLVLLATILSTSALECAASTRTFQVSSGNWNVPQNWDGGVPGAGDRAVIPTGRTCLVTADATADTIEVVGNLKIENDVTLTLENDNDNISPSGPDHSIVDGQVTIGGLANTAELRFESADHTVEGVGVIGIKSGSITIEAEITFTNDLDEVTLGITGNFLIQGDEDNVNDPPTHGHFHNAGRVEASSGDSEIGPHTVITDADDAYWLIASGNCGLTFTFNSEALSLEGDFEHFGDVTRFVFNQNVLTCGSYTRDNGGITIGSGKWFAFVGLGASDCGNPATSASCVPTSCGTCYWYVSTTVSPCFGC